eukprot:COSAG01_NODE_5212_length_4407_cov_3.380919_1_plen_70_part_00
MGHGHYSLSRPMQGSHSTQPARRTHQMMGSGIGRPVIHSSREFPAADRRCDLRPLSIGVQATEKGTRSS